MYLWIWRHLPAKSPAAKAAITVILIGVIALALWYFAFPWLEPRIKFDHGTINEG
ncbi:hypothetical protein [Actinocorallia longicatena]|uniref:Uncharacterized protein n=1 Tax=Actinocorallia longicatena TaxID=111803 RepID=A0ABP6Q9R7_9ACTN